VKPLLLAAAFAVTVAGCASTAPTMRAEIPYTPQADCVPSISQLLARPLPPASGRGSRLDFRADAQCIAPAGFEPEPALLYRIAGMPTPLAVRAILFTEGDNALAVGVTVLDEQFVEIEHFGFDRFQQRGADYRLDAFINPGARAAHYLLLSPDRAWLNRRTQQVSGSRWVTPIVTPTVVGAYADGTEATRGIRFRDLGALTLSVTPDVPAAATGK